MKLRRGTWVPGSHNGSSKELTKKIKKNGEAAEVSAIEGAAQVKRKKTSADSMELVERYGATRNPNAGTVACGWRSGGGLEKKK
ncbi:hypothetical protein CRG98_028112 [Punica granatum]|uniref:Uncharacterized protein n=1 Tax=Punica granatum TaxID=22663 RepID=A0A2I0J5P8_PUNGR|nr:hypothetical protein CRG98_028112 [Punica granatum]